MRPSSRLQSSNRTELYQLCRKAGLIIHPATPREYMMKYLSGELTPPLMTEVNHPVDMWRHGIIGFLLEYWGRIHAQLKCPAKNLRHPDEAKRDARPCFGCLDQQVMTCVVSNAKHEHIIRKHLPQWRDPT